MIVRASLAVVALGVCMGCTGQPKALEPKGSPPPAEPSVPVPAAAVIPEDTSKSVPVAVELGAIGMSRRSQISAEARKANRKGLKAHKKGDYAAARDSFARALEVSPDHDMARYNHACALARLGLLHEAADELKVLLHRDFRRFQPRWRGHRPDPDLDLLRTSEQAAAIDALVPRLTAAYEAAHDAGIAAYIYRHSRRFIGFAPSDTEMDDYDNYRERGGTTGLVAGIYAHEVGRFIPLTRGDEVALLDLRGRRALQVGTSIWEGESHMMMYGTPSLSLKATDQPSSPASTAMLLVDAESLKIEAKPDEAVNFVFDLSLGWMGDRLGFDLQYLNDISSDDYTHWAAFAMSSDGSIERIKRPVTFDQGGLRLLREGAQYFAPPVPGLTLKGKTLVVDGRAEPIPLGRAYHQVWTDSARRYAIVLEQRHRVVEGRDLRLLNDSTVARVDLETGAVQTLAKGPGPGWVVVDPNGALFVEAGGAVQRYANLEAATPGTNGEPIMEGLHLTMPLDRPFCENCG